MIISKAPFGKYLAKVDLGNENFQKVVWTSWIQKMVRQRDDVLTPTGANVDYIYKFCRSQWSDDVQEILTKYLNPKKKHKK